MTEYRYAETMNNWLEQLGKDLVQHEQVMLVSVLRAAGSVPRHPGSKMLIGNVLQRGTIGGGNLEYSAIGIARERLAARVKAPLRQAFGLGPSLGQCCGGRVELLFEYIHRGCLPDAIWSASAVKRVISNVDATLFEVSAMPVAMQNRDSNIIMMNDDAGSISLIEPVKKSLPEVWVFGAGHVGQAVVKQLSLLPCAVRWLDEREGIFPDNLPETITACSVVSLVDEVANAPDDAYFVIMTHSHALDFDLCLSILQRSFAQVGLIGSKTKKTNFEKRLSRRGIDSKQLARLICPIGESDIRSSEPHAIAVGIALQLLTYWQSSATSAGSG